MKNIPIDFKGWVTKILDMPGFDSYRMEGIRGSTWEWTIPENMSNDHPFVTLFIKGTIMQICSNYDEVTFINEGSIHTNTKRYLRDKPGKILEVAVSNKSLYYCISSIGGEILETNEVRLAKDEQYTIPNGWVLFIATGSAILDTLEYMAEQPIYTTTSDATITATSDILGVCIQIPVTGV